MNTAEPVTAMTIRPIKNLSERRREPQARRGMAGAEAVRGASAREGAMGEVKSLLCETGGNCKAARGVGSLRRMWRGRPAEIRAARGRGGERRRGGRGAAGKE